MKRTSYICLMFMVSIILLSGCKKEIKPKKASDGKYATLYAGSTVDYNLFMNRELTNCASYVHAREVAAYGLSSSTNSSELASAKEGLKSLKEAIEQIKVTVPSKGYESTRETTLQVLDVALQHYEKYIKALEENKDVSNYVQLFMNDYNEITSQSSLYNQ